MYYWRLMKYYNANAKKISIYCKLSKQKCASVLECAMRKNMYFFLIWDHSCKQFQPKYVSHMKNKWTRRTGHYVTFLWSTSRFFMKNKNLHASLTKNIIWTRSEQNSDRNKNKSLQLKKKQSHNIIFSMYLFFLREIIV